MNYPKPIQTLIDIFTKLPGIGPRQGARFAFFILKKGEPFAAELAAALKTAVSEIDSCPQCFRFMEKTDAKLCSFCISPKRNHNLIAVVEKESDLLNLEKIGVYPGLYHMLGGVILPLDMDSPKNLHLRELHARIKTILEKDGKAEVVLATNPTTEGDTTALYIERVLAPFKDQYPGFKISRLGRGLSLGSELEYADEVTLKNALHNRN